MSKTAKSQDAQESRRQDPGQVGGRKGQAYRHLPAFILVILAREKLYGAAILARLADELPGLRPDSAAVYRTLQDLEDEGAVAAEWETEGPGPARKWYAVTSLGIDRLGECRADIVERMRNFDWFLARYAELDGREASRVAKGKKR